MTAKNDHLIKALTNIANDATNEERWQRVMGDQTYDDTVQNRAQDRVLIDHREIAQEALAKFNEPVTQEEYERARFINRAMFNIGFFTQVGESDKIDHMQSFKDLDGVKLSEMIACGDIVKSFEEARPANENGGRSFSMVCDDRLVAAIYTFLNFPLYNGNAEIIVHNGQYAVAIVEVAGDGSESDED